MTMELTPEQRRALDVLSSARVSVLLGPPGAGKSFLVSSLIKQSPPDTVFVQLVPMWAQSDGSTTWPIATAVSALNGSKNANPALVEQLECARHSSSEQIRFIIDEAFQAGASTLKSLLKALDNRFGNGHYTASRVGFVFIGDLRQMQPIQAKRFVHDEHLMGHPAMCGNEPWKVAELFQSVRYHDWALIDIVERLATLGWSDSDSVCTSYWRAACTRYRQHPRPDALLHVFGTQHHREVFNEAVAQAWLAERRHKVYTTLLAPGIPVRDSLKMPWIPAKFWTPDGDSTPVSLVELVTNVSSVYDAKGSRICSARLHNKDVVALVELKTDSETLEPPMPRLPEQRRRKWLTTNVRVVAEVEAAKLHGYTPDAEAEEEIIKIQFNLWVEGKPGDFEQTLPPISCIRTCGFVTDSNEHSKSRLVPGVQGLTIEDDFVIGPGTYDSCAALMLISRARKNPSVLVHPDAKVRSGGHQVLKQDRQLIDTYATAGAATCTAKEPTPFQPKPKATATLFELLTNQ